MPDSHLSDSEESTSFEVTPSEETQEPNTSTAKRLTTLEEEPHLAHTSNGLSGRESHLEHSTSTNSLSRIDTAHPPTVKQHSSDTRAEEPVNGNTSHPDITNDDTKSKASLTRHSSSTPSSTKKKNRISNLVKSAFHTGS